jgi:hypothetical protein
MAGKGSNPRAALRRAVNDLVARIPVGPAEQASPAAPVQPEEFPLHPGLASLRYLSTAYLGLSRSTMGSSITKWNRVP